MMKPLLLALAALLLLLAPAEARSRCGPGERALKNGLCATLRPHSPVPQLQGRLCPGGGYADSLGRCGHRRACAYGDTAVGGTCRPVATCSGGACGHTPPTPGAPLVALPHSLPPSLPSPTVPNLAPPPLTYTPGAGLH